MSSDEFAEHLGNLLGRKIPVQLAKRWEQGSVPPGDVLLAAGGQAPAQSLLEAVPPGFPAAALAGPWVTCYQFIHAGKPHYHADIARVTAESGQPRPGREPSARAPQRRARAGRSATRSRPGSPAVT